MWLTAQIKDEPHYNIKTFKTCNYFFFQMGYSLGVGADTAYAYTNIDPNNCLKFPAKSACVEMTVTLWLTVYSKRNAHLMPNFFVAPLVEGGGAKIHMVDYVNGSSTHAQFFLLESLQPF